MTASYKDQFAPVREGVQLDVKREYAQAKMDEVEIYGSADIKPPHVAALNAAEAAVMVNFKIHLLGVRAG